MGTNRVIKTDGDLEITANDTSISGTLNVSGQSTLSGLAYPTSDGSADQVLVTNGSGTLSFADAASGGGDGVDTISSASEAASYSGTNRIIYINTSEHCTFTANLKNRLIFQDDYGYTITFQGDVESCVINCEGNIKVENTSTDGSTDVLFDDNIVNCFNFDIDNSGNTAGNQIILRRNNIHASTFTTNENTNEGYDLGGNKITCINFVGGGSTQKLELKESHIDCNRISGKIEIPSGYGSFLTANLGSNSTDTQIDIAGTTYLSGVYNFPLKIDQSGVQTNVALIATINLGQSISNNTSTTLINSVEEVDNTSSHDTSTGIFTAKVKGLYAINGSAGLSSTNNFDADERFYIWIAINNLPKVVGTYNESVVSNSQGVRYVSQVSGLVNLDVGDTVAIRAIQDSGSAISTSGDDYNFFHVHKIN